MFSEDLQAEVSAKTVLCGSQIQDFHATTALSWLPCVFLVLKSLQVGCRCTVPLQNLHPLKTHKGPAASTGEECGVTCLKQGREQMLWEVVRGCTLTSTPAQLLSDPTAVPDDGIGHTVFPQQCCLKQLSVKVVVVLSLAAG